MTSIYKNAEIVPIWLGRAEDDSDLAIEHLNKFATKLNEVQKPGENSLMVGQKWIQDPNWAPFGPDESFNKRIWTAILKLFSRNWWTRVWIAQEATVPNQQNWVPTLWQILHLLANSEDGHESVNVNGALTKYLKSDQLRCFKFSGNHAASSYLVGILGYEI